MDKQVLIVSLVTGFLGLLSVILGFTAEVTKITVSTKLYFIKNINVVAAYGLLDQF
jgi:hypothetical protein